MSQRHCDLFGGKKTRAVNKHRGFLLFDLTIYPPLTHIAVQQTDTSWNNNNQDMSQLSFASFFASFRLNHALRYH
jgi:hypothetical protein